LLYLQLHAFERMRQGRQSFLSFRKSVLGTPITVMLEKATATATELQYSKSSDSETYWDAHLLPCNKWWMKGTLMPLRSFNHGTVLGRSNESTTTKRIILIIINKKHLHQQQWLHQRPFKHGTILVRSSESTTTRRIILIINKKHWQ
jgi:hypothetical protein